MCCGCGSLSSRGVYVNQSLSFSEAPWDFRSRTTMATARNSHGRPMEAPWDHNESTMGAPWKSHGITMGMTKTKTSVCHVKFLVRHFPRKGRVTLSGKTASTVCVKPCCCGTQMTRTTMHKAISALTRYSYLTCSTSTIKEEAVPNFGGEWRNGKMLNAPPQRRHRMGWTASRRDCPMDMPVCPNN